MKELLTIILILILGVFVLSVLEVVLKPLLYLAFVGIILYHIATMFYDNKDK